LDVTFQPLEVHVYSELGNKGSLVGTLYALPAMFSAFYLNHSPCTIFLAATSTYFEDVDGCIKMLYSPAPSSVWLLLHCQSLFCFNANPAFLMHTFISRTRPWLPSPVCKAVR